MKLLLRSDHGTQYDSADFMNEMKYLGLGMSKAFVRSPECNGMIERFHRTLEEQVFAINNFSSFEEVYKAIDEFIKNYNNDWIMHRLDYNSPIQYSKLCAESQRKTNDKKTTENKESEDKFVLNLRG